MFGTRRFFAYVLAAGVLAASPACAAHSGWTQHEVRYEDHRAYDVGYRDGYDRGREDARRGHRFDYGRIKEYRNADEGYRRGYGDREEYRHQFRSGFARGYEEGFRRVVRSERGYPRE